MSADPSTPQLDASASRTASSSFINAVGTVAAISTLTSVTAFGISVAILQPDGPFPTPVSKRTVFIVFDWCIWSWITGPLLIWHYSVSFGAVVRTWQMRLTIACALLAIAIQHVFWLMNPLSSEMHVSSNAVGLIGNNMAALFMGKYMTVQLAKRQPTLVPPGQLKKTWVFPGVAVALVSYVASFLIGENLVGAGVRLMCLTLGVATAILAMRIRRHHRSHVDFITLFWIVNGMTPMARQVILVLAGTGKVDTLVLIYGYRGLVSFTILCFDELMMAVFGHWTMWGTFFLRLNESLTTLTMALNSLDSSQSVLTYVTVDFVISSIKDSCVFDDLYLVFNHGYCLLRPFTATPGSTRPPTWTSPLSGRQPLPVMQTHISTLTHDLSLQLERSDLTLISRLCALISTAACYVLATAIGRTAPNRLVLHVDWHGTALVAQLLGFSLVAQIGSRYIAATSLKLKIKRLHVLAALVNAAAGGEGGNVAQQSASRSTASLLVASSSSALIPSHLAQSVDAASTKKLEVEEGEGSASSPPIQSNMSSSAKLSVLNTALPKQRAYRNLVVCSVVYTALLHWGLW